MNLLAHLDNSGENRTSGGVGVSEIDLKANYCVLRAAVSGVDYDENTVDLTYDGVDYLAVPFYGHTDIDYYDILKNETTVGALSTWFDSAAYMLTKDDHVFFVKHATDPAKHFAVPEMSVSGLGYRGMCPGTTFWFHSIITVRTTVDTVATDKFIVWNLDKDEESKIVNEAGDGLIEFPCDESDLEDWLEYDMVEDADRKTRSMTKTAVSAQGRMDDSTRPGWSGSYDGVGSGTFSSTEVSGGTTVVDGPSGHVTESIPYGAVMKVWGGGYMKGGLVYSLDWFHPDSPISGAGNVGGRVELKFEYGSTPYQSIYCDGTFSADGYYDGGGTATFGLKIGDVSFSASCSASASSGSLSSYSSDLDVDAQVVNSDVVQVLTKYRSASVYFYGYNGKGYSYNGSSWGNTFNMKTLACTDINFPKPTAFVWDYSNVLTGNQAMTDWLNDHLEAMASGLDGDDLITIFEHKIVLIPYDIRALEYDV